MALFTSKADKKEKKAAGQKRYARAKKTLPEGSAHDVVRAPWFSEKALIVTEKGVYTFAVNSRSTKATIAAAIKEVFGVAPRQVRIVNLPAKKKNLRTKRGQGTRAARRKAYVYLNAGDTLQFA